MFRALRQKILNYLITSLVGPIDTYQVLTYVEKIGVLKLGGEQLSDREVEELKVEVDYFTRTRLYQIFHETLRQKAVEKGFYQSTDQDQVLAGKMMIHSLIVMKMMLEAITSARVHIPQPTKR